MKTNEWYQAWKPGAEGYRHDDILLAIGLQSSDRAISLKEEEFFNLLDHMDDSDKWQHEL